MIWIRKKYVKYINSKGSFADKLINILIILIKSINIII